MQFLKALIVIMGVMIIAGFAFLGVELYKRINDPERRSGADAERAALSTGRTEEVTLGLPAGARMSDPVAVGNRVVFRVTIPDAADRLYVMDPRTGAIAVTVTAGAAAP
ncbi:hypothetical protein TSH58p_15960 [Azospirillum sp. TSH58]|uniref:hypothetical protein n=1 Tax=Azospirillum sp. TSH58 TaxID=664962 RepID=UPI000D603116|nr:hypothetical protein [Azospirillum sp. TSH58]AWJ84885.1 hypothetical protein TSH58p_15960 [Azospirillum sp. TSH58]PWC71356.1 hypothetical protein TSH58_11115 [Azospirillum sp. TSH58]